MALWIALAVWAVVPWRSVQFILLFFIFMQLFHRLYLFVHMKALTVFRRDEVLRGHQGKRFTVELQVENRSFLPLSGATLNDACFPLDSDGHHRRVIALRPGERRLLRYRLQGRERGEYALGPLRCALHPLFGAALKDMEDKSPCRIIIFPRLFLVDYAPRRGLPLGNLASPSPVDEDVTRHRSMRDYQTGDEFKRINWKASARAGRFLTNEFETTLDSELVLVLNNRLADYPLKYRYLEFEQAIEAAASLATAAARRGQMVRLQSFTADLGLFQVAARSGGARIILDALARLAGPQERSSSLFSTLLPRIPFRSTVVYIGPHLEGEIPLFVTRCRLSAAVPRLVLVGAHREDLDRYLAQRVDTRAVEELLDVNA